MAKLSTTLSLYDNFSNKLNKVNNTLQKSGSAMGKFRQLFNQSAGTKLFGSVQSGLSSTNDMFGKMTNGMAAKIGIISGIAQSVTSSAINSIQSLSKDMLGELSAASATWQTFEGNMGMLGKSKGEIAGVKKELQQFAQQTIYSASDMASTYSQLAAVGIKDTDKLVKGFGGLAAAAEDPQQAMKTLSQQATQMAAKPTAQWQDFKLMLEQTPAGIAAIAKTMGMTTSELVKNVQEGNIATQDFFDAIAKTGTNKAFTEMATKFKTIGQATDGLTEGLTNKLQPAFDKASEYGIKFVSNIADRIDAMDFNKLTKWIEGFAPKIEQGLTKGFDWLMNFIPKAAGFISSGFSIAKKSALEFWESFKSTGAVDGIKDAFSAIGDALKNVFDAMPDDTGANIFESLGKISGNGIKAVAQMIEDFATSISKLSPDQLKSIGQSIGDVAAVFATMKFGKGAVLAAALGLITKAISKMSPSQLELAAKGIAAIAAAYAGFKIAKGVTGAIDGIKGLFSTTEQFDPGSPEKAGKGIKGLSEGLNSLAKSAGVALVVASLSGLALAIKPLAELGMTAVAPLATFGIVVAGLGLVLAGVGNKLQTSAVGIVAFAASMSVLALAMSVVANAGENGVRNMATFGIVVGGLALIFAIFGQALNVAIPGMIAFGVTMLMVGAAMLIATPAIMALPPLIDSIGAAFVAVAGAIAGAIATILGAIGDLVSQVASGISQVVTSIGDSISNVITSTADLIAEIGDSLSQVIETISTGISDVTTSVSDGIAKVVESVGGAISGVLDSVAGIFDSIGTAALNAGTGMDRMANAIGSLVDMNLGDMVFTLGGVEKAIKDLSSHGEDLAVIGTAMEQLTTSLSQLSTAVVVFAALSETILGVSSVMQVTNENFTQFASSIATIGATVALATGPLMQLAATGTQVSATLVSAIAGMLVFNNQVSKLSSTATMAAVGIMILGTAASNVLSQITALNAGLMLIVATMAIVSSAFQSSTVAMTQAMAQMMSQIQALAISGMAMLVSAFTSGLSQAVGISRSGAAQIVAAFSGLRGQLFSAGSFAMSGLTAGIQSGAGSAIAAAQSVANQIATAMRAALKIKSPSRVMIAIGGFVSSGLAKGITKAKSMVEKASNGLAAAAVPNMAPALAEGGNYSSNVQLDDNELSRLKVASSQTVVVENKQVVPQITLHVENNSNEPVDVDALADKVAEKIDEAIDSDLG